MKAKQSNNRSRGKNVEREIAKILRGKRVGILGSEDISHPTFSIEVKSRKKFVANQWMQQAEKNNKDKKIPLVVVHESHKPHTKDLVILNILDFKDLYENVKIKH